MSEGGEKANSQTQRRSSNIEVRIPQATTSTDDLTDQEPTHANDASDQSQINPEKLESTTQNQENLEPVPAPQPEPGKPDNKEKKEDQDGRNNVEDGEHHEQREVGNKMDTDLEQTKQNSTAHSNVEDSKAETKDGEQILLEAPENGADSKPATSEKEDTIERSDITEYKNQEEAIASETTHTDIEKNKIEVSQNEAEAAISDQVRTEGQIPDQEPADRDSQLPENKEGKTEHKQETVTEQSEPRMKLQNNTTESKPEAEISLDAMETKGAEGSMDTIEDTIPNSGENQAPKEAGYTSTADPAQNQTQNTDNAERQQESTIQQFTTNGERQRSDEGQNIQQQRAQSRGSQRESRRSSAASSRNLEAMQAALDSRKGSETGFVLSSQLENSENHDESSHEGTGSEEDLIQGRQLPEGDDEESEMNLKASRSSVRFQTDEEFGDSAYLTEAREYEYSPDSKRSHTYSPTYIDTGGRRSPDGEQKSKKQDKRDRKQSKAVERLGLSNPPPRYSITLRPLKTDPDPTNKAPLNPNIYYAEVPQQGGHVKTPFYMHVDIPDNALGGKVRLKFERQEFDRMKLGLTEDDTLCSYIVDLNMEPLSYCLRQNAMIKMRILDKCVNKYEDTVIITARHFSWTRTPTEIESRIVNGEKHYYAVTKSQNFGKFAVINTKKTDRFIVTQAGGHFNSTVIPVIQLKVEEHLLRRQSPQMIEMIVRETRDEAVKQIHEEISVVSGVDGKLVSASPMIEISKDVMALTGRMKDGVRFPEKLTLRLPVPTPIPSLSKNGFRGKWNIVVMQKHTNPKHNTINGYRHCPNAYSKNPTHLWKDVTEANRMAADGVSFEPDEIIAIRVSGPGKYMVLVFEEQDEEENEDQDDSENEYDLHDLSNAIVEMNQVYEAKVMIHQKVKQPSIIFIHAVTADAVDPISKTMQSTKSWKRVFVSDSISMLEWQLIKLEFKGDLQPTVNQMTPQLRFYSKRWQGYQMQIEATNGAFESGAEQITGTISFLKEGNQKLQETKSNISVGREGEQNSLCEADITMDREHAEPYTPTAVIKTVPRVPVYREYKLRWLKNLSQEEIERYKAAHGI